jgi:hypothetical protein
VTETIIKGESYFVEHNGRAEICLANCDYAGTIGFALHDDSGIEIGGIVTDVLNDYETFVFYDDNPVTLSVFYIPPNAISKIDPAYMKNGIYVANYGISSYHDVVSAYESGKTIICKSQGTESNTGNILSNFGTLKKVTKQPQRLMDTYDTYIFEFFHFYEYGELVYIDYWYLDAQGQWDSSSRNLVTYDDLKNVRTWYGTCSTDAQTYEKVATCNGFILHNGVTIDVKFTNGQTQNGATLNVNSTGAKVITGAIPNSWNAGDVVKLTYDGTNWNIVGNRKWNDVALNKVANHTPYGNASIPYMSNYTDNIAYLIDVSTTPANRSIPKYDNNAYLNSTTPTSGDDSTKVATTAFVQDAIEAIDALPSQTGNSGKFLTTNGTAASWTNAPTELFKCTYNTTTFNEIQAVVDTKLPYLIKGQKCYIYSGGKYTDYQFHYFDNVSNGVISRITCSDLNSWSESTPITVMVKGTDYVTAGQKSGTTLGEKATAEGDNTTASGINSHAEGSGTKATAAYAHAEGVGTTASNSGAHAEGMNTTASGMYAHAEGWTNTASAQGAHAEGMGNTASNQASHAEGYGTTASGYYSHSEGYGTTAQRRSQHVFGELNVLDTGGSGTTVKGTYVEIVGNGTADNARSNARTLDWSGNETLAGKLTVGADPVNNMDVATKQYVDNADVDILSLIAGVEETQIASKGYSKGEYFIHDVEDSPFVFYDGGTFTKNENTGQPYSLAYFKNKYIFSDPSYVYGSDDGISWSIVAELDPTYDEMEDSPMYGWLVHNDNIIITYGGENGSYAYSVDGINWTESSFWSNLDWHPIDDIVYLNNKFITFPFNGKTESVSSTDGINWVESSFPEPVYQFHSCVYGNNKYVVSYTGNTDSNVLCYSSDGISWTEVDMSQIDAYKINISFGNGLFVGVVSLKSTGYCLIWSTDGITWTTAYTSTEILGNIIFANQMFVVRGENNIFYSFDGKTWQNTACPLPMNPNEYIYYENDMFIILEDDVCAYSYNGIDWHTFFDEHIETMSSNSWIYVNNKIVCVSASNSYSSTYNTFYTSNKPVSIEKHLCQASRIINSSDYITPGYNCEITSVGEELNNASIFYAYYGSTTYSKIDEAYKNGRFIIVSRSLNGTTIYTLSNIGTSGTYHFRTFGSSANISYGCYIGTDGVWHVNSNTFASQSALETGLAEKQKIITVSTEEPTSADGVNGDIWFVYEE